jgi:hypothetical protein
MSVIRGCFTSCDSNHDAAAVVFRDGKENTSERSPVAEQRL